MKTGIEAEKEPLSYGAEARRLRKRTSERFFSVVLFALVIQFQVAFTAWAASSTPTAPERGMTSFARNAEAVGAMLLNRVSVAQCLTVCVALLGLVATINVALAARPVAGAHREPSSSGTHEHARDQLRDSVWRGQFSTIAMLAGAGAVVTAGAAWTAEDRGEYMIGAVLVTALAAMAAYLAAAVRDDSETAADRALERETITSDLAVIERRLKRIPNVSNWIHRRHLWWSAALRILILVVLQCLASLLLAEAIAWRTMERLVLPQAEALIIVGYSAALTVMAVALSVSRWSSFRTEGSKWSFTVLPYLARVGYGLGAVALSVGVAWGISPDSRINFLVGLTFFIAFGSGPVTVWLMVGATASPRLQRSAPRHRWMRPLRRLGLWAMGPFWGIVNMHITGRKRELDDKLVELSVAEPESVQSAAVSYRYVRPPQSPHGRSAAHWFVVGASVTSAVAASAWRVTRRRT